CRLVSRLSSSRLSPLALSPPPRRSSDLLYERYRLKRVFYSAFISTMADETLPAPPGGPPLLREHRLYQADWLLRFYGFQAKELRAEEHTSELQSRLELVCRLLLGKKKAE